MKNLNQSKSGILLISLLVLLFSLSCEESLPSYSAPSVAIEASLKLQNQSYNVIVPYGEEKPELTTFVLGAKNTYEETLDGPSYIRSSVDIYLKNGETFQHIKTLRYYLSEHITLDPGATFSIPFRWDQKDESGKPMWQYIDPNRDIPPNSSVSNPLNFTATGKIRIFSKIREEEASVDFTMRFIVR